MPRILSDRSAPAASSRRHRDVDIGRPASTLPRFSVAKFWDADSTPAALACVSRALGQWAPRSGARTPETEAAVVMASLMHDVAYYYGGSQAEKMRADQLFGAQIPYFAGKLNPSAVPAARLTAAADVAAVTLGGGVPFLESYSWSYGLPQSDRGYTTLERGEGAKIQRISRETFKRVVDQIAGGRFKMSDVLKNKLEQTDPEYRKQVKASIVNLAKSLKQEFERDGGRSIPGFE